MPCIVIQSMQRLMQVPICRLSSHTLNHPFVLFLFPVTQRCGGVNLTSCWRYNKRPCPPRGPWSRNCSVQRQAEGAITYYRARVFRNPSLSCQFRPYPHPVPLAIWQNDRRFDSFRTARQTFHLLHGHWLRTPPHASVRLTCVALWEPSALLSAFSCVLTRAQYRHT